MISKCRDCPSAVQCSGQLNVYQVGFLRPFCDIACDSSGCQGMSKDIVISKSRDRTSAVVRVQILSNAVWIVGHIWVFLRPVCDIVCDTSGCQRSSKDVVI